MPEATAIKPLYRPHQVRQTEEELQRCEAMLQAPPHLASTINRGEVQRRHRQIKKSLEDQKPRPFAATEIDAAVAREKQLRGEIRESMLTQEEMRKNPPGAVSYFRRNEGSREGKRKIEEWKNTRLRLYASDATDSADDVANVELLRPARRSGDFNLDVVQIDRPAMHIPAGAGRAENISNVMSDADRAGEEAELRALAERLAAQGNDLGRRTLAALDAKAPAAAPAKAKKTRKVGEYQRMQARAKDLGVTFRFGMKKDELARLIAEAENKAA